MSTKPYPLYLHHLSPWSTDTGRQTTTSNTTEVNQKYFSLVLNSNTERQHMVMSCGVIMDSTLSFSSHKNNILQIALFHLQTIPCLNTALNGCFNQCLGISHIDSCNPFPTGIPNKLIYWFSSLQLALLHVKSQLKMSLFCWFNCTGSLYNNG